MFAYKTLSIGVAAPSSLSMAIFEVSITRVVVAGDLSWRETAGLELTVHGRRFIRWFQPESVTGRSMNDMARRLTTAALGIDCLLKHASPYFSPLSQKFCDNRCQKIA